MDFFDSPLLLSLVSAWAVLFVWLLVKQRGFKKCPRCKKTMRLKAAKYPHCAFEFPDQTDSVVQIVLRALATEGAS
jgi:hypothetical protein